MERLPLVSILLLLPLFCQSANIDTLIIKSVSEADSLRGLGKADKALSILIRVRSNRDFNNASCESRGLLYHKIGVCNYTLDDYEQALKYWRDSSLLIRLACLGKNNKETANSYYAIAMAYRFIGDRKSEGKNVRQALEILESLPDKDLATLAYNYLQAGSLFDDLEDFGQAIYYYEQAGRIYNSLPEKTEDDIASMAELKKLQGLAKSKQGQGKEGVKDLFAAIDMYRKMDPQTRDLNLAHCYNNLAIAYIQLQDYRNAEKFALLALNLNKATSNTLETSNNYEILGFIKKKQTRYNEALAFFRQSLDLRKTLKAPKLIANAWENIADVSAEQQDYVQAIEHYQTAVSNLTPGQKIMGNSDAVIIKGQSVVDRPSLLRVIGLEADARLKRFAQTRNQTDLEKAFAFYRAYDTLQIQIRQQFKEPGSKYWLMRAAMPVYENAIATALRLNALTGKASYLEEAYLFSARSKAAVLLEGLQESDAKLKGVPTAVLEQEKAAKEKYAHLEQQFFEKLQADDEKSLDPLRSQMFEARRQYEKFIDGLESKYPEYYDLKYALPTAATINTLRRKLPKDAVVLEYFIGVGAIYIFEISQAGIRCFQVEKPGDFEAQCSAFIRITNGSSPFTPEQYTSIGNALYRALLKDPLQAIGPKINRLIIIPDNLLLHLSFDVLPYEPIVNADSKPYLIRKYALSITYSNQLIFEKNKLGRKQRTIENYGGFGLEYDDFTLQGIKSLKIIGDTSLQKRSAGRLPNSDDEIAEIAKMLHGDAWINARATKNAFVTNAPKYSILHLAMHGIIDETDPLNSALIFSREKDNSEDFILRAAEIYGLDFNAEMAVLSACNTGNGDLTPEGVRSLARAFTHAGCPSLVASLWFAYDDPTRQILVAFFGYLQKGLPKDIALQKAKLDYLSTASPTYVLPEYWSNLIIVGDPSPLTDGRSGKSYLKYLILFIIAIGSYLFYKRK